jgi:hypothetical protein
MQYRLRTLLILLAIFPPLIAGLVRYREWREDQLWRSLESAKQERDELLLTWRKVYDRVEAGRARQAEEDSVKQRYFSARQDVQRAVTAIQTRYGKTDAELLRAMESRRERKRAASP